MTKVREQAELGASVDEVWSMIGDFAGFIEAMGLPVEMALEAKKRGIVTVTVGSIAFAKVAPLSEIGRRLAEVCDFAIDNGGVPGDGIVSIPGLEWKVGPTSTVMGALIWNALVVETTHRIQIAKGDAPVGVSFNMPGYAEYAKALEKKKDFNLAPMHL